MENSVPGPNEVLMVQAPKIGVTFERTVSVRPYESMKASIYVQADVPMGGTAEDTEKAIRDAFLNAKASVFEQLGIAFELDEHGVVHELITKAFGPVEKVPQEEAPQQQQAPAASNGDALVCGNNPSHKMWDNRQKKAAGEYKPSAPDGKCSQCDFKAWPAKAPR